MKVCIAHEYFYPEIIGGVEQSLKMMIDWLVENKTNIEFMFVTSGKKESIDNYRGVKVYRYKRFDYGMPYLFRFQINLKRFEKLLLSVCKEENINLIHSHFLISTEAAINVKNRTGIKVITTVRDHGFYCKEACPLIENEFCHVCSIRKLLKCTLKRKHTFSRSVSSFINTFFFVINRNRWLRILEKSDVITSTSNFIFNNLRNNGIKKQIKIIPNFTNFVSGVNFKNKKNFILFVGRLIPEKGILDILKIVKEIKGDLIEKNWKLIICGDGYLKETVKDFIKNYDLNDVVVFKGKVDYKELEEMYKISKITIIPSKKPEGFGRVALEAITYGSVVLGYDSGGISEIVKDSGKLVKVNRIEELKMILLKFLKNENDIKKLYKKAIITSRLFNSDKIMNAYINLYRRV